MDKWQKIIQLLNQSQKKEILVFSESENKAYIVKELEEEKGKVKLENEEIVDEVNKNISFWQAEDSDSEQMAKLIENTPKQDDVEDDQYYIEPVE